MACGICKKDGHNSRTCPQNPKVKDTGIGSASAVNKNTTRSYGTSPPVIGKVKQIVGIGRDIQGDLKDLREVLFKKQQNLWSRSNSTTNLEPEELVDRDSASEEVQERLGNTLRKDRVTSQHSKKLGIHWFSSAAKSRLDQGPTEEDGPGYIYIYKVKNPENEDENCYKIGLSRDLPERRVKVQEKRNKQVYEILSSTETPYRYMTETTIHRQLHTYHTPKAEGDGRTEWFTGSKDHFIDTIRKVIREVKALYLD